MTEHGDPIQRSDTGGKVPRCNGWHTRGERVQGELVPDPSSTLSASEIGAFTYCPQAWYLQRCRVPLTPETDARRQAGSRAHRDIGRQTDLVRVADAAQPVLLLAIIVLLVLLAALVLRWFG